MKRPAGGPVTTDQVVQAWRRIDTWLHTRAPRSAALLRPPASPTVIAELAQALTVELPEDVVVWLGRHDGCGQDQRARILPGSYRPLTVAEITDEWRVQTEILDTETDYPELRYTSPRGGPYWHPGFVPLAGRNSPDLLVCDARPGEGFGAIGDFFNGEGTGFDYPSLGVYLTKIADSFESGEPFEDEIPNVVDGSVEWDFV
jgi:cell wall assembly regulator SMI1